MPSTVTLKTIADAIGVSTTTVSLALRGDRRISESMRLRVRRMAETLGYVPNAVLSELARSRWQGRPTGDVVPFVFEFALTESEQRGMLAVATAEGITLEFHNVRTVAKLQSLLRQFWHRHVQVVIAQLPTLGSLINWDETQLSLVGVDNAEEGAARVVVSHDRFHELRFCFQQARKRGYRRIGAAICRHTPMHVDDDERLAACLIEQHRSKLAPGEKTIPPFLGDVGDNAGFIRWFRRQQPDCVIAFRTGHHSLLEQAGIRVPEQTGYVCLHLYTSSCQQPDIRVLTGILVDNVKWWSRAVLEAVHVLEKLRHKSPTEHVRISVHTSWQEGRTLPVRG